MPDLDAIRQRANAASESPWETTGIGDFGWHVIGPDGGIETNDSEQGHADAEFIAHARDDVPALLDEITRLKEDLADAERYMNLDRKIALKFSAERDAARARLDSVRALCLEADAQVAVGPSHVTTDAVLRALDGESTSVQPDDDCGGWTTSENPPCGGCTACLRAQDYHRQRNSESTKDGA